MKRFLAMLAVAMGVLPLSAGEKNPQVVINTSMGAITVELLQDKAPISAKNFLKYVDDKHYDGTIFHRVIDGFMVQGGGMEPGMKEKKTGEPIKNESTNGLSNARGTLAMARTNDPDSATAQFYINVVDNKGLDRSASSAGYAVFGRVVEGMDVVDAIRKVETGNKGFHQNVPVTDIVIRSVRRK